MKSTTTNLFRVINNSLCDVRHNTKYPAAEIIVQSWFMGPAAETLYLSIEFVN